jgi:hypothetical protein
MRVVWTLSHNHEWHQPYNGFVGGGRKWLHASDLRGRGTISYKYNQLLFQEFGKAARNLEHNIGATRSLGFRCPSVAASGGSKWSHLCGCDTLHTLPLPSHPFLSWNRPPLPPLQGLQCGFYLYSSRYSLVLMTLPPLKNSTTYNRC